MVLHPLYKNTNALIVSEDTDVLILLEHMYTLKSMTSKWCIEIENGNSLT